MPTTSDCLFFPALIAALPTSQHSNEFIDIIEILNDKVESAC